MPNKLRKTHRSAQPDLALLLIRFPDKAETIRRFASVNEEFCEICEHYALARSALKRFLRGPSGDRQPEVADYKVIVADLEQEILDFIASASLPDDQMTIS